MPLSRRDLLKAIAAFAAAPIVGTATLSSSRPAAADVVALPEPPAALPVEEVKKLNDATREFWMALWRGDYLPVEIGGRWDEILVTYFEADAARRLGATEARTREARELLWSRVPTSARAINGGYAVEVRYSTKEQA